MNIPGITLTPAPAGDGFNWKIIADCGRVIVDHGETFATDIAAFTAGKTWRSDWMERARNIDET